MRYQLITGRVSRIEGTINGLLKEGWEPLGPPFRTGNRILKSGQSNYPNSCDYTSEVAQCLILKESPDAQ